MSEALVLDRSRLVEKILKELGFEGSLMERINDASSILPHDAVKDLKEFAPFRNRLVHEGGEFSLQEFDRYISRADRGIKFLKQALLERESFSKATRTPSQDSGVKSNSSRDAKQDSRRSGSRGKDNEALTWTSFKAMPFWEKAVLVTGMAAAGLYVTFIGS